MKIFNFLTKKAGLAVLSLACTLSTMSLKSQTLVLNTGIDQNGNQLMIGSKDPFWNYQKGTGTVSQAVTMTPATSPAWGCPTLSTDNGCQNTRWLTNDKTTGVDHIYTRTFTLPSNGKLYLRALGDDRNYVYLDGVKITETTFNTALNGWLNSRNPSVDGKDIAAGTHTLKVVVQTIGVMSGMSLRGYINYGTLSTNEVLKNKSIQVYPTLTEGMINVVGDGTLQYQLYDLQGKLIQSGEKNDKTIDISKVNAGNYVLKVTNLKNGTTTVHKIIKK